MSDRLGRAFPLVLGAAMFAACLGALAVWDIRTVFAAYVMAVAIGVANGVMFTSVYAWFTDRFSDTTATAYGTKVPPPPRTHTYTSSHSAVLSL